MPPTYRPRPWEIDDLFDLGRREGESGKWLKSIPVLILENWVNAEREVGQANYVRSKWIKNRLESSGLHEPFIPKGTSNLIAAMTSIQKTRNLTPPLINYEGMGEAWVNLPVYEKLLQIYRKIYCKNFPDDYRKLYPNPEEEPIWEPEVVPVVGEKQEIVVEVSENLGLVSDTSEKNDGASLKQLSIFQLLEDYEKSWHNRLEESEKRARIAEQEIADLKLKLSQSQAELREVTEKFINQSTSGSTQKYRQRIPEEVRFEVWRRDNGMCAKPGCESRENLEFDHIIPLSKGGSNTARNIELLCEKHNRSKKDNI